MENAEEVMQLLEEFSKIKPKDIPRELEDYLGYVAKTGDPVFQWSLVKCLFREKLLNVITDFYESTLTVELPPCPNVESFNYDRMKTSLLERFDTFCSAPFTVQRICELLTNPRKEYNRADKYMRAIEKNILVVSTREPGSGKRPLECDVQSDTVLNGIPDMKLNEADGGLLHVPTDLPYLGAPPASNDVTVETSESNLSVNDRVSLEINGDTSRPNQSLKSDTSKDWEAGSISGPLERNEQSCPIKSETLSESIPLTTDEQNCDINVNASERGGRSTSPNDIGLSRNFLGEGTSEAQELVVTQKSEPVLPDSIGASDSMPDQGSRSIEISVDQSQNSNSPESPEPESGSDENEVSSTPTDVTERFSPQIQEEEESTGSEAESTNTDLKDSKLELNSLLESEVNSSDIALQPEDAKLITISEITCRPNKSDEIDLKCNEITGTVDSPASPAASSSTQAEELNDQSKQLIEQVVNLLDESEKPDIHPDSSNDICIQSKTASVETCSEADSLDEDKQIEKTELLNESGFVEGTPDQSTNEVSVGNIVQASSPDLAAISENDQLVKSVVEDVTASSPDNSIVSEGVSSNLTEGQIKITEVESSSEIGEDMCEPERREASVIQSVPNIPDSQQLITIEEISVDPSCEAEEEAMDVDDSSNQMMVSEGENEGEPMDESDQLQS